MIKKAPELIDSAQHTGKRVLLVEDDERLLRIMAVWLTSAGHEVVPFGQFLAARAYLEAGRPDVIITDVRLGAFNGLHLVILAKCERPEINAIVLTGFDDPVLRRETSSAGAHYLVKPISLGELLPVIEWHPAVSAHPSQSV